MLNIQHIIKIWNLCLKLSKVTTNGGPKFLKTIVFIICPQYQTVLRIVKTQYRRNKVWDCSVYFKVSSKTNLMVKKNRKKQILLRIKRLMLKQKNKEPSFCIKFLHIFRLFSRMSIIINGHKNQSKI